MQKITIKEIAKIAGVSRGTVDRVLNNRGKVAKEKEVLVQKIAEKYGYEKNLVASNLALNQQFIVGVLIPDVKNEPYWEIVKKGIASGVSSFRQHRVRCVSINYDLRSVEDYLVNLERIFNEDLDFILLAPVYLQETLDFFKDRNIGRTKVVTINSELDEQYISTFIGQNSYTAGLITAKLFHKNIHAEKRRILCVTLGHQVANAIHITKKLDGLKDYSKSQGDIFEITEVNINDFQELGKLEKINAEIETSGIIFDGIFFTNSRVLPYVQASTWFKNRNQNTCVVGFDLTPENVQLLKDGIIDFLLDEQPFLQGRLAMLTMLNDLIYRKNVKLKQYLPIHIIIKENVEDYCLND